MNPSQSELKLDGKIVFTSFLNFEDGFPKGIDVFIVDADGQNLKQLTDGPNWHFNPTISSDAKTVAYVKEAPNGDCYIYLINSDGTSPRQLVDTRINIGSTLDFSPDNQRILFSLSNELMLIDLADNLITSVPSVKVQRGINKAAFSADGTGIIYEAEGFYFVNLDGSGQRQILEFEREQYQNLAVSPDGTTIAFEEKQTIYHQPEEEDEEADYDDYTLIFSVFAMNLDGSGLRKLSEGFNTAHNPTFSPDGTRLAFIGTKEEVKRKYTIKLDGSDLREIENEELQTTSQIMAWSWS